MSCIINLRIVILGLKMYKVNLKTRNVEPIKEVDFSDLDLTERYDIQEWISNNPEMLEYKDKLLIIQKEFDGFKDTNRRLDLLALDEKGNIVIIENKRDDSGADVTWQAINYASFCSTLTKQDVINIFNKYLEKNNKDPNAEQILDDFLVSGTTINPPNTQRIILVAHNFRAEVLSSAQWLNNNGLDITCIQFKPYDFNGQLLVETDRILPQDEMKDYTLKLARKNTDTKLQEATKSKAIERNIKFWKAFSEKYDRTQTIFKNINSWDDCKDACKGASAGFGKNISFLFVISNEFVRVELYIDNNKKEYNKNVFDKLYSYKDDIEKQIFPNTVSWERLDLKNASRVAIRNEYLRAKVEEDWPQIIEWFKETMPKLIDSLSKYAKEIDNII